jgi:hypothetical protein
VDAPPVVPGAPVVPVEAAGASSSSLPQAIRKAALAAVTPVPIIARRLVNLRLRTLFQ